MVQDYVAGRLSDADRRAFEEQLLSDASLVRDLEESLRLREGLEMLREQKVLGQRVLGQKRVPGEAWRPRRPAWFTGFALASAAALAAIVVCVGFYYVKRSPPMLAASVAALRSSSALVVVKQYSFAVVREATSIPELDLPTSGALELRALTPITGSGRTLRVTLSQIRSQKTSRIGVAEHLAPNADGFVVIYADASTLEQGDYSLSVEPDDIEDKSAGARFAFKLKRMSAVATPNGT